MIIIIIILIVQTLLELSIVLLVAVVVATLVGVAIKKFEVCYRNWKYKKLKRESKKDYGEYLQRKQKEELHRKEMEKYPLFYWKDKK